MRTAWIVGKESPICGGGLPRRFAPTTPAATRGTPSTRHLTSIAHSTGSCQYLSTQHTATNRFHGPPLRGLRVALRDRGSSSPRTGGRFFTLDSTRAKAVALPFPARSAKKFSDATVAVFSATAERMNWFTDTLSSAATFLTCFISESGSLRAYCPTCLLL